MLECLHKPEYHLIEMGHRLGAWPIQRHGPIECVGRARLAEQLLYTQYGQLSERRAQTISATD